MRKILLSLIFMYSSFGLAQDMSSSVLDDTAISTFQVNAGRESYIKFVIFVEGEQLSVEYFDSNKINLHVDYLKTIKNLKISTEEIYKKARFNEGRDYFFGAVIFSPGETFNKERLSYQITAEDPLHVDDLVKVGKLLSQSLSSPTELSYMASGNQAKYMDAKIQSQLTAAGFPVFQSKAYQSQTYYEATSVGRLKVVSAKDIENGKYLIQGDEILVLDYVPDSLPPVRGVITSTPTSPNSHVSLLARMYSIPFLFLDSAFTDPKIMAMDGRSVLIKTVETQFDDQVYLIEALDEKLYDLYETIWIQRFPKVTVYVNEDNLQNLSEFPIIGDGSPFHSVDTCGAKASNGSILSSLLGAKNSITGFCIPFYYMNKFLLENKVGEVSLRDYILQELAKVSTLSKLEDTQSFLLNIQQKIDSAVVSKGDIQKIKAMILKTYGSDKGGYKSVKKVRFRSSSNAEDDERFNGAGLYESDGLKMKHIFDNNDKKVEESLKIVWSSLYGMRAVLARKMFHIDEAKVYMGILVNQAFEETANGVSICDLVVYSNEVVCRIEGYPGGELSVAIPVPGSTSEIVRVAPNENYPFGVMSTVQQYTSELGQYERVLSEKELGELYALQLKVYKYWSTKKKSGFSGSLDFEWKRMQDLTTGQSYMAVKQVREVPPKLVFSVQEPVLYFPSQVEYITGNVDGSATVSGLLLFRKIRLSIPQATSLKDTQTLLQSTKIMTDDFKGTNYPLSVKKVLYSEGNWELNSYEQREERKVEAVFFVEHPVIAGLEMTLSYTQIRANGATLVDNFVDPSSATVSVRFPEKLLSVKASKSDFYVVDLSLGSGAVSIPPEINNYCIKGAVVATTTATQAQNSIYQDGATNFDKAILSKTLFKKFKNEVVISETNALVNSQDSHAFEAGQYVYVKSIYLSAQNSQKAGLKAEDHYVVFATGMNYEAEVPLQEQVILFNNKFEAIEKRNLSECPGEEPEAEKEFSGAG